MSGAQIILLDPSARDDSLVWVSKLPICAGGRIDLVFVWGSKLTCFSGGLGFSEGIEVGFLSGGRT